MERKSAGEEEELEKKMMSKGIEKQKPGCYTHLAGSLLLRGPERLL